MGQIEAINDKLDRLLEEFATLKKTLGKPTAKPDNDLLTKDQAIQFLAENGLPMKDGQLYFLSSTGKIPCKRIGKRLVFSKKELLTWLESNMSSKQDRNHNAAKLIASAARKRV
jgi:hypothetical protein